METAFVYILVSIIDLPSIISIIGGIKAKRIWQVGLIAIIAAICGVVLHTLVSLTPLNEEIILYKLVAQFIVAYSSFYVCRSKRRRKYAAGDEVADFKVGEKILAEVEERNSDQVIDDKGNNSSSSDAASSPSSSNPSPLKEMGRAACDVVPVVEQAAKDSLPVLVRFLGASWNLLMKGLSAIGLMPYFKRSPWLHGLLIFLIMAIAPYLGVYFLIAGLVANSHGAKAENDFMFSVSEKVPERFMGAESDEEEREAYQGEAMLRVYESGASTETAQKVYEAMGELYDKKKRGVGSIEEGDK